MQKRTVLLAALVLGVAVLGLLAVGWFPQEAIRGRLEQRLQASLGAGSRIARVRLVPGRLSADAHDLVIESPSYRLEVPHARLRLQPGFLVLRPLAFRLVELDQPRLVIHPGPGGSGASASPLKDPLFIHDLRVRGGTVVYERPGPGAERVTVRDVNVRGSLGTGALDVDASGAEWRRAPKDLSLTVARGRVRVSPRLDVEIERLELGTQDSVVRLSGSLGRVGDIRPDLRAEGTLALADATGLGGLPEMSGDATFEARMASEGEAWALQASMQLLGGTASAEARIAGDRLQHGRLTFGGIELGRLREQGIDVGGPLEGPVHGEVAAAGTGDALDLQAHVRLDGRMGHGRLHARLDAGARVDLRDRRLAARWTAMVDGSNVGGPASFRVSAVRLRGHGRADGRLPPVVSGTFAGTVAAQTASGTETMPVTGAVRMSDGAVAFEMSANALAGTATMAGALRGSYVRQLRLDGRQLELGRLRPDLAGTASILVEASGRLDQLTGYSQVGLQGLVWNGVNVGELTADVEARAGRGTLAFEAPALHAVGRGRFDQRAFEGTLTLDRTPLAALQPVLAPDRPLNGQVTATAEVVFPFARPAATVVQAAVQSVEVASGEVSARSRAPFTLTSRDRRVSLQGLDIEGPGLAFRGEGEIGRRADAPMDLRGRLSLDLGSLPPSPGGTMSGTIEGEMELRGTPARPEASGLVSLHDVVLQRPGWPAVTIADGQLLLEGDVAHTAGLRATWPGGELNILGRVPLAAVLSAEQASRLGAAPGSLDVEATFDLDLASLPARPGWRAGGTVQGDLLFSGTRHEPQAVGLITLENVTLDGPGGRLIALPSGQVDLSDDVASTTALQATVAEGTVTIEGRLPLAALLADTLAQRFRLAPGDADLRLSWRDVHAGRLVEAVRRGGSTSLEAVLSGEASLRGRFRSVDTLQGTLHMDPFTARVQGSAIEVSPVEARLGNGTLQADVLTVRSSGGEFRMGGSLDLRSRRVSAQGKGGLELRALSPFLEAASLTGHSEVELVVEGPLDNPQPQGTLRIADGTVRLRDIRQPVTGLSALVTFRRGGVTVQDGQALLGGGRLTMSGEGALEGLRLSNLDLEISARDVGLRYPIGGDGDGPKRELKARMDGDLTLTGSWGDLLLGGTLTVERSLYDADIFLEEGFLAPEVPPAAEDASSPLSATVALNVLVATGRPFIVRNNLAELQAEGALWVRGDLQTPAPFGRFELRPGGKLFLQEREFALTGGALTFAGDLTNPDVSMEATTVISHSDGDFEVTVVASGPLAGPRLSLSSSPPLSQQELASLVATGRTSVALGNGAWIVGEQAAALLAGRVSRRVSRQLLDLGLDQVEIQPELIAREGAPSARFTFGKRLTRDLRFIYSYSLSDPEANYYQALLRSRRVGELSARVGRREDGGYSVGGGQRLRFGGPSRRREGERERERVRVSEVRFEGSLRELPALASIPRVRAGDRATYWNLLDDADRIRERLVQEGYMEAVVEARFDQQVAVFGGSIGPRYRWRVEGMDAPPDLTKQIQGALFEEEAAEGGRQLLLDELRRRGHLRAGVEVQNVAEGGSRVLVFKAQAGPVLSAEVRFPGARALPPDRLLEAAGGPAELLSGPRRAEDRVRAAYRAEQFLAAEVGPTEVAEDAGRVIVTVPVVEGPPAVVREVSIEGSARPVDELKQLAALDAGQPYDPRAVDQAVLRLRDDYLKRGYPAVRVEPRLETVDHDLRLWLFITEGAPQVVGPVTITGLRRTRESFVRGQLRLEEGGPLDPRTLAEAERRLRNLGIFRRVAITASSDRRAAIAVELQEDAPLVASWDVRYNQDEGVSGLIDAEVENLLGRGVSLGGRVRGGQTVRELRGSLHLPVLGPGDLTASAYWLKEDVRALDAPPITEPGLPLEGWRTEQGLQLQQALHDLQPWGVLYGYRAKRTTCPERGLPPRTRDRRGRLFDPCERSERNPLGPDGNLLHPTLDVAGADTSLIRDSRDNPLDPTRGSLLSLNVFTSPQWLGSDFDFLREFAQASFVVPLRPGAVAWAQGYRLGLIQTMRGQRLPYDDLFKAGGPTSVRGFSLDSLGPTSLLTGEALGGKALVVINQELRFRHQTGLGAALFWDAGNVFAEASDLGFDLRHSLGVGLRYDSIIGLVRFDLAFPIARRPGEARYRFSFGLGQAF